MMVDAYQYGLVECDYLVGQMVEWLVGYLMVGQVIVWKIGQMV